MSIKVLICLFFLLYGNNVCLSDDLPEVRTPLGEIRGVWQTSLSGRRYAAFIGIPYAKPPVGELRFEEPQPIEPWPGVWDASSSYSCIQHSIDGSGQIQGDEDCLYLNVFVPTTNINSQNNFDILVYIHGGAFMMGSGYQMANANLFMDRDIIAVTINYRLGILGFLSTEDEVIPGNDGMRDQVLALKWVRDNIASFGGNPNSVTISGLSAGAAAVHLHYFSPLSKGLFVRGLSQSGTAVDPWVIQKQPLERARRLAALVGCSDSSTQELKQCLKKRPAVLLTQKVKFLYDIDQLPIAIFAPVAEKNSKNPFLSRNPYLLLKENSVLDVPWIVSTTADEGLLPAAWYFTKLEELENNWLKVGHYFLETNYTVPISRREEVSQQIKDFYLGPGEKINKKNFKKFTKIFTDRLFAIGAETSAKLQSKANKSPVYYYLLNYRGENSLTEYFAKGEEIEGVSHGDDGIYFYGIFTFHPFSETDKRLRNACLDMLYSYVTTGKASFDGTDQWKPTGDSELTFLNISHPEDIKLQTVKSLTSYEIWKKVGIAEYENLVVKDEL